MPFVFRTPFKQVKGPLSVANGGTGAASMDTLAQNLDFTTVSGLTPTDGNFIVGDGSAFVAESGSTALTSLGVSAFAQTILDDAAASDVRTTLGLGSSATESYEEGSWTPVISFGGSTTGVTYGTQIGRYVRMGEMCVAYGRIVLTSNGSGTGTVSIAGLPFTSNSNTRIAGAVMIAAGVDDDGPYYVQTDPGATTMIFRQHTIGAGINGVDETMFTDTVDVAFNSIYRTS